MNSLYKTISDEAIMAILAMTPKGECVYANAMAHDLLEFPLDFKIEKLTIDKLFAPAGDESKMRRFGKETLEMQGLIQEIVMRKLNGQQFIAMLGLKRIQLDENCTLIMIQDITLQKKLQREITEKQAAIHQAFQDLLVQNKQLKDLDVAKNRFIAMTTHELRTPLSAMVASAEILKMKLFDDEAQHDEFVTMIHEQGQHLLNLVNDILDFAKIQSNKMDYFVEQKDLNTVVETEVAALQTMAAASKVTMSYVAASEAATCYFDEVRIKQVLANLINNAIKYNRNNGTVTVSLEVQPEIIKVNVRDTGKGIGGDDQAKVFNEFETLGKVANHAKGTGLGLPISQRMMKSMGGDVKLSSEEGVGSNFWIEVPRKKVLAEENYRSRPEDTGSGDLAA